MIFMTECYHWRQETGIEEATAEVRESGLCLEALPSELAGQTSLTHCYRD